MATGSVPRHEISSMEPKEPFSGPLIVPLAIMSPARRLQPLTVWWASGAFRDDFDFERDVVVTIPLVLKIVENLWILLRSGHTQVV